MVLPSFLFPAVLILLVAGPEGAKNLSGRGALRLIQIRLTASSLEKLRGLVKPIRYKPESPLKFQKRRQLYVPRARQTAFRRRDARRQSRLFARRNPRLRRSPTPSGFTEIASDDLPVFHASLFYLEITCHWPMIGNIGRRSERFPDLEILSE
jgi:hypothetical protein